MDQSAWNKLRLLDWPPVWTAAAVAVIWLFAQVMPWEILGVVGRVLGAVLVLTGFALMLAAAIEMTKSKTTVIPRRQPSTLVTSGIFEYSRNPIYLGDVLVVAGAMLWLHLPWALPMVAVFAWVLRVRFIDGEEQRLIEGFGADYGLWAARTGRWFGRSAG